MQPFLCERSEIVWLRVEFWIKKNLYVSVF